MKDQKKVAGMLSKVGMVSAWVSCFCFGYLYGFLKD